jgi:hypothetical protein
VRLCLVKSRLDLLVTHREAGVFGGICIFLWAALACLLYAYNIRNQLADGAFAAQILFNFKSQLWMSSTLVSSILEAMKTLWYKPAEVVCAAPLTFIPDSKPLTFHLYVIGYLLIPVARVLQPDVLIAMLHALVYTSVPALAYLLARRVGINMKNSALLALCTVIHPLWHDGLFGQFYFNRLFIPLCATMLLLLNGASRRWLLIAIFGLLAASTAEIYGLVLAVLLVSIAIVEQRDRMRMVVLATALGGSAVAGLAFTQISGGSSSTQDGVVASAVGSGVEGFVRSRLNALSVPGTGTLIILNMAAFGLVGLGSIPHLGVGLLQLLPNLLVSVGGAEKTGWATHYHVGYWPIMIWVAALGAARIHAWSRTILSALLLTSIVLVVAVDPESGVLRRPVMPPVFTLPQRAVEYLQVAPRELAYRDEMRRMFEAGDTISGPEPALYNLVDHPLYYYPLNIDTADRVIFVFDQTQEGLKRFRSINYGHQDESLDSCIVERMRRRGFDFDRPGLVGRWAVVGRSS